MGLSQRILRAVSLCCIGGGVILLGLGAVTYKLGFNDTHGLRIHGNGVPLTLFAGVSFLMFGTVLLLARVPQVMSFSRGTLGILALTVVVATFAGMHIRQMKDIILVRADILNWSETPFMDNIIRFRAGQPQFTPPEDANANLYTPGASLLTYAIARLLLLPISVPYLRLIQQVYILVAVLFATLAARELFRICQPESRFGNLWLLVWIPFLYLIGTNPVTSIFTSVLHNDASALMINAIAFWLLTKYATSEKEHWLIPMVAIPALGYWVKQKEAVWLGLYVVYFFLAGNLPLRRVIIFGLVAFMLVGGSVGLCYVLWGHTYVFWTFRVPSALHVALNKTFEQLTDSAWYLLPGFVGAALVLRGADFRRLFPVWVCWLFLLLSETYTSGIAFRPTHLAPATFLASIWLLVGLARSWPERSPKDNCEDPAVGSLRMSLIGGAIIFLLAGYGFGDRSKLVPSGLNGYIAAIEEQTAGLPVDRVLLDFGSWIYLPTNVVMKDRAPSIGNLTATHTTDFAMTLQRIRNREYLRILVHKVRGGTGLSWDARISQALAENYREVSVIPSPGVSAAWPFKTLLEDVTVLEALPKPPIEGSGSSRSASPR
jgi:hypothetical protein